jgi:hypothetical protein
MRREIQRDPARAARDVEHLVIRPRTDPGAQHGVAVGLAQSVGKRRVARGLPIVLVDDRSVVARQVRHRVLPWFEKPA